MGHLVRQWIPFLIAIITALTVLLGYLLPPDTLVFDYRGQRTPLPHILVEWAVIVGSFAFILGAWNILRVHIKKIFHPRQGGAYSLFLVLAALGALVASFASPWVFNYVISPIGASLAALVVFTLSLAAFRLLRVRRSPGAIGFVVVVAAVLLTSVPLAGLAPELFSGVRHWVVSVFGMAGMRGLLLGVVLGTAITALRFLWPRREP
jgi:hypothetical protein